MVKGKGGAALALIALLIGAGGAGFAFYSWFTQPDVPLFWGIMDGDIVTSIDEKPEVHMGNLISTGIYLLDDEFIKTLPDAIDRGVVGLSNSLEQPISQKKLKYKCG